MDMIDVNKKAFVKAAEQLGLDDAHILLSEIAPGWLIVYNRSWIFLSSALEPPCGRSILEAGNIISAEVLAAQNATQTKFLPMGKAVWERIESYREYRANVESRLRSMAANRDKSAEHNMTQYSISDAFYAGDYEPLGSAGVDIRAKDIRKSSSHRAHTNAGEAIFWFEDKPVAISTELVKGLHALGFHISVALDEAADEYNPYITMQSDQIKAFGMVEPARPKRGHRSITRDGRSMCISELDAAWCSVDAALEELRTKPELYLSYAKSDRLEDAVTRRDPLGKVISVLRWKGISDFEINSMLNEDLYSALDAVWDQEVARLEVLLESMEAGENSVYYYKEQASAAERRLKTVRGYIETQSETKVHMPSALLALHAGIEQILDRR